MMLTVDGRMNGWPSPRTEPGPRRVDVRWPARNDGGWPSMVLVTLGSNIEPEVNLPAAVRMLSARLAVRSVSRAYETEPVGSRGQPHFLNAAVLAHVDLPPLVLKHQVLRRIEADLGRVRTEDRFAPRTIDLDIALFGNLVLLGPDGRVVIPDPDLLRYAHAVVPAADVAPDLVHPTDGRSLRAIAHGLREQQRLRVRTDLALGVPELTAAGRGYGGEIPFRREWT
jgi:2-amino-4-hydroxy-6-hydroxymethyldihydropteridine diphosphokinase